MFRIVTVLAALPLVLVGCGTSQQPISHAPPPHALGPPRVLVSTPGLSAFAQDGGQIAWWSAGRCPALHVRTIATGAETRIPRGRECANAEFDAGYPTVTSLAFAGGRALWSVHTHGNSDYEELRTASLSDPEVRSLDEITHDDSSGGLFLWGMAGDSTTLVYTAFSLYQGDSGFTSTGGYTRIVGATTSEPVGAFAAAVSGRLAAFLRSSGLDDTNRPHFDGSTPVEVRDVQTGELVQRVKYSGEITSTALSPEFLALLIDDGSSARVETYSVDGGNRQAKAPVPSDATDLSIDGETVVFRSAQTIYVLNARSGRKSTVAVTKATPISLSIEHGRIAWAEKGRIAAVYLSAD
jgi:hypothetical protein